MNNLKHGRLAVVGLGPGDHKWLAPEAALELQQAQEIIGYAPYLELAGPFTAQQILHPSDNRQELERAQLAFTLAARGRRVAVVSSGDPGIFAMATAVLETLAHTGDPTWQAVELIILPGISAVQMLAARVGAPLGHDFCVLSLSDNLKPWEIIKKRLILAAQADFVIALYNPSSRARPSQINQAFEILKNYRKSTTPVILGQNLARAAEQIWITTLGEISPTKIKNFIDMRTVLIIGSSQTQSFLINKKNWVFTPRSYI